MHVAARPNGAIAGGTWCALAPSWRTVLKEEFLHHIWKFGLFNQRQLVTTDQRAVEVIDTGMQNHQAGPDFFNAKVRIADATWVGNVEIHVDERDWFRHGHHTDKAYNNVVLHVVHQASGGSQNQLGNDIPVLELQSRISRSQFDLYASFIESEQYIPCEGLLKQADPFIVSNWLERILVNRLERKSTIILDRLNQNRGDWQQTLFEQLAINFGFKINALPMELLARSIPVNLLAKYQHNLNVLEALLFGQAGLLNETFSDSYPQLLQNEYAFLQKKHRLVPIKPEGWKFGRLRPPNFPTIRIAQLASVIHHSRGLFAVLTKTTDAKDLHKLFSGRASEYWDEHHQFDAESARTRSKVIGKASLDNILINTVAPFLFAYSRHIDSTQHLDTALELLESISAEDNNIVRKMQEIGFPVGNAAQSQALLELKAEFCDTKKCLSCAIGGHLLKTAHND